MSNTPRKPSASPWAVALLVLSSSFAAISVALFSTGFVPA
jgi:hypothetical protein